MRKEEPMTPKEMALLLAQALDSKKGKDIRVLETIREGETLYRA